MTPTDLLWVIKINLNEKNLYNFHFSNIVNPGIRNLSGLVQLLRLETRRYRIVEDSHSSVIFSIYVRDVIQENPGNADLSYSLSYICRMFSCLLILLFIFAAKLFLAFILFSAAVFNYDSSSDWK